MYVHTIILEESVAKTKTFVEFGAAGAWVPPTRPTGDLCATAKDYPWPAALHCAQAFAVDALYGFSVTVPAR